jgi:hypothetical protein
MKKLTILILAASLTAAALAPAAAEDKVSKPRSSEVVLVARFVVSPAIDREFYSHYVTFEAPGISAKPDKKLKGKTPDDTIYLETNEPNKAEMWAKWNKLGIVGEIGFVKVSIPKKREIELDDARVYVVDNDFLYFDLPVLRKISVPEGVNYVYLGTFTYSVKDEFFMISDIAHSDEFDDAAVAVTKAFGKDAELTRVNLLPLDDPAGKK